MRQMQIEIIFSLSTDARIKAKTGTTLDLIAISSIEAPKIIFSTERRLNDVGFLSSYF